MKNLLKLFVFVLFISSFFFSLNAYWGDLFPWSDIPDINITDCEECDSIEYWLILIDDEVNSLYTEEKFSEKVQDVVLYLIWFVSFIAIIYIVYAWFMILTWAWEEEKLKKAKAIIFYVAIWIIVIWLSYSIFTFIVGVLDS